MKKAKKVLLLVLCAALLVGASVAGTVAYLTSSGSVTNTFTTGNVAIKLEEYDVDGQTGKQNNNVVTELNDLELVPGRKIEKQPFITVDSDSEDCWLFVKVENGLGSAVSINGMENWENLGSGYYRYPEIVKAGAVIDVFTSVTCDAGLGKANMDALEGKQIVITAYAVQSEGVSADAAFTTVQGM